MAGKDMPFDEDVMTLIMGVGGPGEPGQHGRTVVPSPGDDAITVITSIRDLCEDFLKRAGKEDSDDMGDGDDAESTEEEESE